jgi:hypothetical protein
MVGADIDVVHELAGQEIPTSSPPICVFPAAAARAARVLLSLRDEQPVFLWRHIESADVFLLPEMRVGARSSPGQNGADSIFSELLPLLIYLQYACGDHIWHAPAHLANLTIDDAWLTNPYGSLSYSHLLEEMEAHNFHTTLALIPWNFDRSEADVVRLFASHANRYSVSIHGNDHVASEFGNYRLRPLSRQIAGIKQALARMSLFQTLTGLNYDKVMIFPQELPPPEATLRALERYNFIGAANAVTVPEGRQCPSDYLFPLRVVSSDFNGLPIVRRYSVEARLPTRLIAINSFLGNPLLFYCHASLFDRGIGAFDSIADQVNRIEPETRWASLGEIMRHLYLIRLRADNNYDVWAFSNDFLLSNNCSCPLLFYVTAQGDQARVASLTIDGKAHSIDTLEGYASFVVRVEPQQVSHIVIEEHNDLDLGHVDTAKGNIEVVIRRKLSDLRDITLSRSPIGRTLIRLYYKVHLDTAEAAAERFPQVFVLIGCAVGCIVALLRVVAKARRPSERVS